MPLSRPNRRRLRLAATSSAVLLALLAPALPASAAGLPAAPAPSAETASAQRTGLDRAALDRTLKNLHDAGMYGAYSAARDGAASWQGASGVADVKTGRPMTPQLEHRIGSITKTFTATAVLQQVGKGRIGLNAPIGRYLPDLVPGERGQAITVRMLLDQTSGINDYDHVIFAKPEDLEANRYRQYTPREVARIGLAGKPLGKPGEAHHYANTNYVIAGLLLGKVTGQAPEEYIAEHVIRKAGLRHTYFPRSARLPGPHAKIYEGMYGLFDPPRDFTDYNVSWAGTAGALVSTMDDLNRFTRALLSGKLIGPSELRQMKTTVPTGSPIMRYGLGLFSLDLPNCGRFWGHNGLVWGSETMALSSEDGQRQVSLGTNLTNYYGIEADGQTPKEGPIDYAKWFHIRQALCDTPAKGAKSTPAVPPTPQLHPTR
ncbi:hydrolase [Streptomyces sp. CB02923]|uniref:serine hydrolase domain-containing protein n=1 Tax=Streptomyces sp. CB02923 TaxID=1718985 RepID=UPI00093FBB1A|nr:serine hydrolase domain-containing protein [Streptomyces sp. CB02923]OKI09950.1 hydrolase [Streptomyces sp. CB02923]